MDALAFFEKDLAALIGRPTARRPFVCDGSPLDCQAFIVGFNPATTMDADFWEFWHTGYGFKKVPWRAAYEADRRCRGKTGSSKTRTVLDRITTGAAPVSCLETNLYSMPSKRAKDLPKEQRDASPFEFLLDRIRPKVLFVYNRTAHQHLCGLNVEARIIAVRGPLWLFGDAKALECGHQIKAGCSASRTG